MRTHYSWGLVLFRPLVSVAVVRLMGLVADARPMAEPWPRPARCHCWARPGHGGPGGQPHDRGPSQSPLRVAVRVGVLRRRRTVGECLPGPGVPYLYSGTGGGCVATGAHRLPGLRSPLLRDPCA